MGKNERAKFARFAMIAGEKSGMNKVGEKRKRQEGARKKKDHLLYHEKGDGADLFSRISGQGRKGAIHHERKEQHEE